MGRKESNQTNKNYIIHMDILLSKISQQLLDLGLCILKKIIFSESVTTSDGYFRGYVSFAHFLLYLVQIQGQENEPKIVNILLVHSFYHLL